MREGFAIESCCLELKSNGQFIINAPDNIFNAYGNSSKQILIKNGKWSVSDGASYDCLIELEGICVVPFCIRKDHFAVPITIGDGDECRGIVFEKVN